MIICPDKDTSTIPFQQPFHIVRFSPACSATSRYVYLPPQFEDHTIIMNVSLDTTYINAISISTEDFKTW